MKYIEIKKAHLHNLKEVSVDIPKNKLIVVTGVSGSGKTSLICDILDEAGSGNYLENLGISQDKSYSDDYESIYGLNPTISVKNTNEGRWNPRSLVGTRTGILSYLRLLYTTNGELQCESCGRINRVNQSYCECKAKIPSIDSRELSVNSTLGRCAQCNGTGYIFDVDLDMIYNNKDKTLAELCTLVPGCSTLKNQLSFFAEALQADLKLQFKNQPIHVQTAFCKGLHTAKSNFRGIEQYVKNLYMEGKYPGTNIHRCVCPKCNGDRLSKTGRNITIHSVTLPEASQFTIYKLMNFIMVIANDPSTTDAGKDICRLMLRRLNHLIHVDLGYLNLFRSIPSLSGGEFQRLKLAALLESTMEDLVIIVDEPLTGLHPKEKNEVLDQLCILCVRGNTVILVEHNIEAIKRADYIIDFGVYGGLRGGNIIYSGDYKGLLQCERSITSTYIKKIEDTTQCIDIPDSLRTEWLMIKNAYANNLKHIDVEFPLHTLVGITGVSGSGKSSLIAKTLVPLLKRYFDSSTTECVEDECSDEIYDKQENTRLLGTSWIDGYVYVAQTPIGRNNKSTVATYVGLMKQLQMLFAKQTDAHLHNLKSQDFSFNSSGACSCCNGTGQLIRKLGEDSLSVSVCPECDGTRFQKSTLVVKLKGKTISQVLDLTVEEGITFFESEKMIQKMLFTLKSLGLEYLTIGQSTPTLSSGEGQKLKLAKSLMENKRNLVYLFDEPSIGLSLYDIEHLLHIFQMLIQKGHSVIVIEHDVITLSNCKWLIEMGPGSDLLGGEVIAKGSPEKLKSDKKSFIGKYL